MNGRVLVLCASRDRNTALERMIASVRRTSTKADIAVYVDEDQAQDYSHIPEAYVGPRIGPVASLNALWKLHPGYDAYGAATDDCEFVTPGWDNWVLETAMANPVTLLSPRWSHRMDFPWATAAWCEALGWFAFPDAYHYYWDVFLEILGKQTDSIVYATAEQFSLTHDAAHGENTVQKITKDSRAVLSGLAYGLPEQEEKIRKAKSDCCSVSHAR